MAPDSYLMVVLPSRIFLRIPKIFQLRCFSLSWRIYFQIYNLASSFNGEASCLLSCSILFLSPLWASFHLFIDRKENSMFKSSTCQQIVLVKSLNMPSFSSWAPAKQISRANSPTQYLPQFSGSTRYLAIAAL